MKYFRPLVPFQLLIVFAVLIFIGRSAFASDMQMDGNVQRLESDLKSEKSNKKKLTISSFLQIPTHSFLISTDAGRSDHSLVDQRIQYNPTFGPNVGVRATYDFWSFHLSKRLSFISSQEAQTYGKSDYDDLRIGFNFTRNLAIESYYQNYHGFYADLSGREGLQTTVGTNDTGNTATPSQSQIVNRPDISALNYGFRLTHTLRLLEEMRDPNFEMTPIFPGLEVNVLTKAYYNRLGITGDRPLVPAQRADSLNTISSLKEFWSNTVGVGAGLGLIVPMGGESVFGFDAVLGAGLQRQTNVFMESETVEYATSTEMNTNLYVDWRGPVHKFRVGLYWDTISSSVRDINFDSTNLGLNFLYTFNSILL